ncbi:hypothetical protein PM082_004863 [Marasmius tenuissimus]|nr:hypothetical protein PM082_004863 [Marasmius tenuissimus]
MLGITTRNGFGWRVWSVGSVFCCAERFRRNRVDCHHNLGSSSISSHSQQYIDMSAQHRLSSDIKLPVAPFSRTDPMEIRTTRVVSSDSPFLTTYTTA